MSPMKPRRRTTKKLSRRALASRRAPLFKDLVSVPRPFSKGITVIQIQDGVPDIGSAHLQRNGLIFQPDRVQWVNLDGRGRVVVFKDGRWPFVECPQRICVPAHGSSQVFTIYFAAATGAYKYLILPPEEQGPGGGPEVVIDP